MLEFDGLPKSYGAHRVLDGVGFAVAPGSMFGFCGAGEVRWRGGPLDDDVRRRIGCMPEERGLYPRMRVGPGRRT